jgi:hypothetical protein
MTLPDERYRSIQAAGDLLLRIAAHPKLTPRVPKRIREEAAGILRHYPGSYDLQQLERSAPHVVQQRMEPLYKMVLQHETQDRITEDYRAAGMIAAEDDHEGSTLD